MNTTLRFLVPVAAIFILGVPFAARVKNLGGSPPAPPTYVGQQTCGTSGCHQDKYLDGANYSGVADFGQTLHQKIHLRPNPQTVVIDRWFRNDTVLTTYLDTYRDTLKILFSKGAQPTDYFFQMILVGAKDTTEKMKVEYTYGGVGWMQRFLVKIDGSYCIIPFQYCLPKYMEHTDTGRTYYLDLNRWIDGTTSTFIKHNTNAFRKLTYDRNCVPCHVNGFNIKKVVNGADTSWESTWAGRNQDSALQDINMSIGCESCHGPGSDHVANPRLDNIISPRRFPSTRAGTDLKLDLCGQCRNRVVSTAGSFNYPFDETNKVPYIPGVPLRPYIKDPFTGANTWDDKVTPYAHHQTGQDLMRAKPYLKHAFGDACWTCHEVHKQGNNGLPFQLKEDFNSMTSGVGCVNCHEGYQDTTFNATFGRFVNNHSMHSQSVSQCVNCHFTKTATITFANGFDVSQHGFNMIRPTVTLNYRNGLIGVPNTCAMSCHRNGRGNRNADPATPVAPAYGTNDRDWGNWHETSDLVLADSLWYHYQQMYKKYTVAVREPGGVALATSVLSVYPNPSSDKCTIRFGVGRAGRSTLNVYDLNGRFIKTLSAGLLETGTYSQYWDLTDEMGKSVPNGNYLIRLNSPQGSDTKTIVVAK